MSDVHDLASTYLHLGPDGTSVPLAVDDRFWIDLGEGRFDHLGPGRLVSHGVSTEDWPVWEMHPAGEEVVCLLSGAIDFVTFVDGTERITTMDRAGSFVVVPRGTWHTARVRKTAALLFITAGDGTDHRPVAEGGGFPGA